jgi:hypothetical protein
MGSALDRGQARLVDSKRDLGLSRKKLALPIENQDGEIRRWGDKETKTFHKSLSNWVIE